MEQTKLKPCPFCGGAAVVYQEAGKWYAECGPVNGCEVHPITVPCGSIEEALRAWNRRKENENERV